MIVKLLTEHHLEFLSLKGGCRDSSESTLVKLPHCWKSHVTVLLIIFRSQNDGSSRRNQHSLCPFEPVPPLLHTGGDLRAPDYRASDIHRVQIYTVSS